MKMILEARLSRRRGRGGQVWVKNLCYMDNVRIGRPGDPNIIDEEGWRKWAWFSGF
jgi:hypothetical protein